jgi:DNA-binding NarL/FixJ family response regulator
VVGLVDHTDRSQEGPPRADTSGDGNGQSGIGGRTRSLSTRVGVSSVTDPLRVLVVDDHRMFSEALELLLGGEADIRVIGTALSGEEALAVAAERQPDVVIMDIDLPWMDGIEATRALRATYPDTRVVIVSGYQDRDVVAQAIEAGASGYIPKADAADGLADTLRRAARGEMVLPSATITNVVDRLHRVRRAQTDAERRMAELTRREIEVLEALAEGHSTLEVARQLFISPLTVQTHVKNILQKLGVHSKLEAVTFAVRQGSIRFPSRSRERLPTR